MTTKKTTHQYTLVILIIIILLNTSSVYAAEEDTGITWDLPLIIKETNGIQDTITLGEAINAHDTTSPDQHDLPKPPPPIPPSIHAFFTSPFDPPYNNLLQDYRPQKNIQTWNLTIIWIPADFESSTTITISWDTENLSKSSYTSIQLYQTNQSEPLTNMLQENTYTYTSQANMPTTIQIQCKQSNTITSTPFPSIIYLFIALFIGLYIFRVTQPKK